MQRVFILGNPRSGTSLLRIMLNNHAQIASPPECGFMHWWYKKYSNWSVNDSLDGRRVNEYVTDVLSSKKMEDWKLKSSHLTDLINLNKPQDYADLSELVYLSWAQKYRKTPSAIVDKNNYYIHHLKDLEKIWPSAKYIYLVRDGRDVACSYLNLSKLETLSPYKPKLPTSIHDIAHEWIRNNQEIISFLEGRKNESYYSIRYEDLILNTKEELESLCRFLELPMDAKMLDYYLHNDEPESTMDWKMKTLEKPDAHNIGKYEQVLSIEDIATYNRIAKSLLNKFRYYNGGQ